MKENIRFTKNIRKHGDKMMSLKEIAEFIRTDETTRRICERLRAGNLEPSVESDLKKTLAAAEINSVTEGSRKTENITELTGYIVLDLDDTNTDWESMRKELAEDDTLNPVLIFTSPRGKLKVVLKVAQLEGRDPDTWRDYYRQCALYVAEKHGVFPDAACCDPCRLHFMSHDPEPYYNPDETATAIEFYPEGDYEIREAYDMHAADSEHGIRPSMKKDGYNAKLYEDWLKQVKEDLVTENGEYVFDRTKKVFIGSNHLGTAEDFGLEYKGYPLKYRISVCAMWLYGNDTRRAQSFVDSMFEDGSDRSLWNACCGSHARFLPEKNVLLWLLKTFDFKSLWEIPTTVVEFTDAFSSGEVRDVTVAETWDALSREHGIPGFFNDVMSDRKITNQWLDIRLYSALASTSGFATNERVRYNQKDGGLNLILNVLGTSAAGKGEMTRIPGIILDTMNRFAALENQAAYLAYKEELADYNKRVRNAGSTEISGEGFDEGQQPQGKPEPPMVIVNCISMGTKNAWARVLKQNNGKVILMNTEYSNVTEMERTQYGGLKSAMKNLFDNDSIGNLSDRDLREGYTGTVEKPNCGVLLSGTFDQFKDLYKSYQDGLLTRSVFCIVPTTDYEMRDLFGDNEVSVKRRMEMEFVQWHVHRLFGPVVSYTMSTPDYDRMRKFVNSRVNSLSYTYDDGTSVGEGCRSLVYRFPNIVFKTAALLQSFDDFEKNNWNPDYDGSVMDYLNDPKTWVREKASGRLEETGYAPNAYAKAAAGDPSFITDDELSEEWKRYRDGDMQPLRVALDPNWVEAAWKILLPSLYNGFRVMSMYSDRNHVAQNPKKSLKYTALGKCPAKFKYKEYKEELSKTKGAAANDTTTSRYLKQLEEERLVAKKPNGQYWKIYDTNIK